MNRMTWFVLLVLALAAALAGCGSDEEVDLIIVSPHTDDVQEEFAAAFSAWHEARYGTPVRVEWRNIGGTGPTAGYIKAQYERSDSSGLDVLFGGGAPTHEDLAGHGVLATLVLPAETLEQIPETLQGVRQRDGELRWVAACVSSFGILVNERLADQLGVAVPRSWDDLAAPAMVDEVTAAGPNSGSALAAYELMLQSAPDWPAGWRRLLSFWANCKTFTDGASAVPNQIADGEVVAGTCIDYYAFKRLGDGDSPLRYVLPPESALFTPDPIAILKGAPHEEMARRFVEFVLSPAGQGLWCLPPGVEGGPAAHALYRQPIRRDTYATYSGKMLDQLVDIYAFGAAFELDQQTQSLRMPYLLDRLMDAAAVDNASLLRQAWRKLVAEGMPAGKVAVFAALPEDLATAEAMLATARRIAELEQAGDHKALELLQSRWHEFFRAKYQRLLE